MSGTNDCLAAFAHEGHGDEDRLAQSPRETVSHLPYARLGPLLAILAVLYAVLVLSVFPKWTVDDAYITYRYAENLARTGELTWNPGEDPVEGYTGVALPVILAAAVKAGLDPDMTSKAIGVAALFATALFLYLLLGRLKVGNALRGAFVAVYLAAPILFAHALSGLETMLFSAVLTATLFLLQLCVEPTEQPRSGMEIGALVLGLLAGLIRPEGVVLLGFAVLTLTILRRVRGQAMGHFVVRLLAFCIVPGLAYFAWRYSYYGQMLPNTYYAKWSRRIDYSAVRDLGRFLLLYASIPFAAAAIALAGAIRYASGAREKRRQVATELRFLLVPGLGLAVFLIVLLQYSRSALIMNYSHRFFAPFYPVLLTIAACAVSIGLRSFGIASRSPRTWVVLSGVVLALCLQVGLNAAMLPQQIAFAGSTKELLSSEHIPVGLYLRTHVPSNEWLVVVVDAGAIPYFSGLKTVDFGGLNDEFLSRRFRDKVPKNAVLDYFFAHNPGALVFTSTSPQRIDGPEPLPIESDPRLQEYARIAVYSCPSWPQYYELIYVRRDLLPSGMDEAEPVPSASQPGQ